MTQTADEPVTEASAEQAVVILSGLSGGGKTAASKLFEDLGYTVVDNLPAELLPELADLVSSDRQRFARVAIVVDVRAGARGSTWRVWVPAVAAAQAHLDPHDRARLDAWRARGPRRPAARRVPRGAR